VLFSTTKLAAKVKEGRTARSVASTDKAKTLLLDAMIIFSCVYQEYLGAKTVREVVASGLFQASVPRKANKRFCDSPLSSV